MRTVGRILDRAEKNDGNADLLAMGGDRKSLENELELVESVREKLKSGVKLTSEFISKFWKKQYGVERTGAAVRAILKKYGIQLSDEQVTGAGKSGKVKAVKKKVSSGKQKLSEMRDFLSEEEIAALKAIIKKDEINDRIKNRCRAIMALDRGEGLQSVMNFLQVSRQTVRTWLRNYLKGGLELLTYWGYAGMRNHCKTTLKQERQITAYIRENPTISLRKLRAWMFDELGISYGKSGVHRLVKRLGFKYRKAKLLPKLPPVAVQKAWLANFHRVVRTSPAGTVVLYFDGFHPRLHGDCRGCWVEDGMTPVLEQATSRDGLNILGALNTENGKFTYQIEKTINKDAVIRMLERIKKEYSDAPKVIIVLDNARYHKNDAVTEWVANQPSGGPHIQLHFLLPYCPHFNLIERLWKKFREEVTHNNVQENLGKFIEDSLEFLNGVEKNWHKHASYVKVELKPIDPDNEKYLNVNRSSKKSVEIASKQDNSQIHSIHEDALHMHQGSPP